MGSVDYFCRSPFMCTSLHLIHVLYPEYGVFLHNPEEMITDFEAIRNEIIRVTDQECGPTGFSSSPISLTIYSPRGK